MSCSLVNKLFKKKNLKQILLLCQHVFYVIFFFCFNTFQYISLSHLVKLLPSAIPLIMQHFSKDSLL